MIDKESRDRVKAWLRAYLDMTAELHQVENEIQFLTEDATSPKVQQWSDMPHGSGGVNDAMTAYLVKKERLVTLYVEKRTALIERRTEIEQAISRLPSREREVLRYKYLDGLTWEQVAEEMSYSWRHVHNIHSIALNLLVKERGEHHGQ